MRVLFVFSIAKRTGGAAHMWLHLLDGLMERGVEPFVLLPEGGDGSMEKALQLRGITYETSFYSWWVTSDANPHSLIHRIRRRFAHRLNSRTEERIEEIILGRGIDLVYICDGTITAGIAAAEAQKIPVVWHFHQYIDGGPGGISFIDSDEQVEAMLHRVQHIIAVTKGIRTDLRTRFPGAAPMRAIYNGVPEHAWVDEHRAFDAVGEDLENSPLTFTLAGRFDANKNQIDAIEAFAQIASTYPRARLLLVGSGTKDWENRVKQAADKSGVGGRVLFLGDIYDMTSVWRQTDVALNCSFTEGCSLVIAESMGSGCLVLGSDAPGNAELLGFQVPEGEDLPEQRALIYPRGDADGLAEQMRWAVEHVEEARVIAERGKTFARETFDLPAQVAEIHETFAEVMA